METDPEPLNKLKDRPVSSGPWGVCSFVPMHDCRSAQNNQGRKDRTLDTPGKIQDLTELRYNR